MKIYGVGDLVCDLYYENQKLIGMDGGKSFANIVVNLADRFDTYIWGACGTDYYGDIALKSLEELGVSTQYVKRYPVLTRLFHIDYQKNLTKKKDFVTHQKTWYPNTLVSPFLECKEEDVLIMDSLNSVNQAILKHQKGKKMLDIGYFKELSKMTQEEIYQLFQIPFAIINLNGRVEKYLLNRFHTLDFLKADLIIITYGKKGAKFLWGDESLFLPLECQEKEVDSNGLGDLFFAEFIAYYLTNAKISKKGIQKTFKEATRKTSFLATQVGARGHLHKIYSKEEK